MGNIFEMLLIQPITNIGLALYVLLNGAGIPYALGFSIILLTVIIRLFLYPVMSKQMKSAKSMQMLAPHLSTIKEKHKDDKKKQQEEMMKLYKEHGINPAAGCLPLIIQLPVLWSLYKVLSEIVSSDSVKVMKDLNQTAYFEWMKISEPLHTGFFGLNLAHSPSKEFSVAPYLILVPVLTGVSQFILSKMMLPAETPPKKDGKEDFQTTFQKQSLFIFPIMIGFFSFSLPVGLSLYWNTFTLFGILHQYKIGGWGGMLPIIHKIKNR